MSHPDDYDPEYDRSGSLGIQQMPEGYALMINVDLTHHYWFELATGARGRIHWNKWSVYRQAKARKTWLESQGGK